MGGLLEGWHPVVLLIVVLIIFGPGKLVDVAGQLGRGVREFREAVSPDKDEPLKLP